MIKTTFIGSTLMYQSDNYYNLPVVTGTVQWNGALRKLQVSTGSSWVEIDNNITYQMHPKLDAVIEWAELTMQKEKELKAMMDKHPALKDAKERFDLVYALIKDQQT